MKHFKISIFILAALCAGCGGNSRKLTLPPAEESADTEKINVLFETEVVMDTVAPRPGIKFREVRKTDPSAPPVLLNLAQTPEEREFRLTDYYSSVKYVTLKHPFAGQGKDFLGDSKASITYNQGSTSVRGLNSAVYLTPEYIVAGDNYFGYHCYDRDGNFLYTVAAMEKLPDFNRKTSLLSFEQDNSMKTIRSFSVLGDNCLIYSVRDGKPRLDFHNIPSRKTYLSRPFYGGRTMLINPETFISYQYYNMATETRPFLYAYEMKGDTLCRFMNRNPLIAPNPDRRAYTNPDAGSLYYYDNRITVRQSYSDTVYRMTAPNELTAAYVLDFGSKRADINTALFGDKSDRLIPNNWLETARFIFIIHTRNYDCPANRGNKSVTFYYSCFDKRDGKLYSLPSTAFPEDFFLPNDVEGGLPLIMDNARSGEGKLYIGYTKLQLTAILNHKNFASLPAAQQEKTRAACEELNEGEMLLMILEQTNEI